METIQIHDKQFRLYLPEQEIETIVQRLANQISSDYQGRCPMLCPILTGSFLFAADLVRAMTIDPEVHFVRYTSYQGLHSTGKVTKLIAFPKEVKGRDLIIVEDIIDSGISMEYVLQEVQRLEPASVRICTFFFKPNSFQKDYPIHYIGKEIPNDFILGYGLDYNNLGRTLRSVYVLNE